MKIIVKKPYFVILKQQREDLFLPLTDKHGDLAMFEKKIDANEAGNEHLLGSAYGFEVFEIGGGIDHS